MNFPLKKSILSEARLSFVITKLPSNVVHHFTLLIKNSLPNLQLGFIWYSIHVAKANTFYQRVSLLLIMTPLQCIFDSQKSYGYNQQLNTFLMVSASQCWASQSSQSCKAVANTVSSQEKSCSILQASENLLLRGAANRFKQSLFNTHFNFQHRIRLWLAFLTLIYLQ